MAEKTDLKILYVEDEADLRERIAIVLKMHFATVLTAANGREGLEIFLRERPDIVVTDVRMPLMDGLEMTQALGEYAPGTPVILCTAFTETTYLLEAIELGVAAYVRKPLDCRELISVISRAALPILQQKELTLSRQGEQASLELLLGGSSAIQESIRQAQLIAQSDFSLLIQGETGVGKSHLASIIHGLSRRRQAQFITVTLSALPETLAESQLFGHLKGSFTGALATTRGLFEEANGGTLFLDDVDCASPVIQAKLLHAVESKQFYPVGGVQPVSVDTRIISASNRDLLQEVQKGRFREDLFYRLGETVITLPPLRHRGEDILLLARRFLGDISRELDRIPPRITSEAALLLNQHPWHGNVRELKSTMKRAALFAGESISAKELAGIMTVIDREGEKESASAVQSLEELKRDAVKQALAATGGKKMEAARILDVDYSSFKRMLDRYGI
ncbi:MAG: sigma-54 dependent transcriptional regulator [Desulfuromonadaceae bacterium]|nr:sigma-54 dependent transcriptional regulator [Desulfuromonadaceae bacterium]MDD5106916.1 sigma-54 dependent transcriptional regulator [Desulfuromonadaceae bacterium]